MDSFTPKIETGIPIPLGRGRHGINAQIAKAMKVGDSVSFPSQRHFVNFYQSAKREGIKICARTQSDGGIRVWRIEESTEASK